MANNHLDVRRHAELFDPYKFDTPVTILGAGATGSWLALALAKLGIDNITVWDFDIVEEHNVPNQLFGLPDVGESKVKALYGYIDAFVGTKIKVHNEKFTSGRLQGIVFCMVDSMTARKEIWENSVKMKSAVKLFIEPRMGLNEGRVYCVDPTNLTHIKRYEDCWYSDEESVVSACGTSQTVITSALMIASICARSLINFTNGVEVPNELLIDMMYNQFFPTTW
jgi:molybdopterin/thiamine biosynthesis adenylyltransferase